MKGLDMLDKHYIKKDNKTKHLAKRRQSPYVCETCTIKDIRGKIKGILYVVVSKGSE